MLMFVIQHQPHRAGTDLRRELVACLLAHGSTFSRVGASGKPGAVHPPKKMAPSSSWRTRPKWPSTSIHRLRTLGLSAVVVAVQVVVRVHIAVDVPVGAGRESSALNHRSAIAA